MSICQVMISDFLHKTGRLEPVLRKWMYSNRDLRIGIEYCQDLKMLGYKKEPYHGYNLNAFIKWAEHKVSKTKPKTGRKGIKCQHNDSSIVLA